jgi:hypothetical protein
MTFAENWVQDLANVWQTKDIDGALKLFRHCIEFRETPFDKNAAAEPDGIRALWEGVHQQSQIEISAKVRIENGNEAVAEYRARYEMNGADHESSGIWFVKFEKDHCVSFEQWFMEVT